MDGPHKGTHAAPDRLAAEVFTSPAEPACTGSAPPQPLRRGGPAVQHRYGSRNAIDPPSDNGTGTLANDRRMALTSALCASAGATMAFRNSSSLSA